MGDDKKDDLMAKVAKVNELSIGQPSWRETFAKEDSRRFSKLPRFSERYWGEHSAKVLPGVSAEQAQAMVKRFFALWPETAKYLGHVRRRTEWTCSICGQLETEAQERAHGVMPEYIEMLPDPSPHEGRWSLENAHARRPS